MNNSLLSRTLQREKAARNNKEIGRTLSWGLLAAGEEFNKELGGKHQQINNKINLIDLSNNPEKDGKWLEEKIREICNNSENKELIKKKEYPLIWFKDINKVKNGSALEWALLPIFDPHQNNNLFAENIDLSLFILLATSSTQKVGEISSPLLSRLDCINIETAVPKKHFLDKHFSWVLIGSLLLIIILLLVIFWLSQPKVKKKLSNN